MFDTTKKEVPEAFEIPNGSLHNCVQEFERISKLHSWVFLSIESDYESTYVKGVRLETDLEQSARVKEEEELRMSQEEKLEDGRKQLEARKKQQALLEAAPDMLELLEELLYGYDIDGLDRRVKETIARAKGER